MDSLGSRPRILIVEESRMVRAMIVKGIRDHYEYREETDGEAAWQTLVLDSSIELVISALSLPILSGNDLLLRVRESRLARLNQMPMLMISGDNREMIENAKLHGASDFIGRNTVQAELLTRIGSLLMLSSARKQLQDDLELRIQNPKTGLFTRKYIELQALQALALAIRNSGNVSVMTLDFDNLEKLREVYGDETVAQLQKRFVSILLSKIRKEDSLGHLRDNCLAVVSPGTPLRGCEIFANRLRDGIASANISIQGQRLSMSLSIGISNVPDDKVSTAEELINLADERLGMAKKSGGNCIVSS